MKVMDKKKKIILISAGVVLAVGYLINRWLKNLPKPQNPDLANLPDTASKTALIPLSDKTKVLSIGSKGLEVGILQHGLGKLVVDGIFGVKTLARLKEVKGVESISLNKFNSSKIV